MAKPTAVLPNLQRWVVEYLPDGEGKKPNTIRAYKDSWRLVVMFFANDGIKAEDITYDMLTYHRLMDFFSWIEKERSCKVSTRNARLAAISKFADYSANLDFESSATFSLAVGKLPFKSETDSTDRTFFTKEEVRIFLDAPTPKSNMGIRDHVLLQFMYASGTRAEEVCIAKVKDITFLKDGKASVVVHGKGGKTRRIKIFEAAATSLRKYIRYRRIENQPEAFIFPSQRNERMSVKCLEEVFARYLAKVRKENPGLFLEKTYTPHSMRHTTAMHMLEAGVPMVVIKQFLGHAHLSTTEIYAKLSPQAVNQKLREWNAEYWNQYIDEEYNAEFDSKDSNDIPSFLM